MSNIAKGIYVFNLDGTLAGHFRTQLDATTFMGVKKRPLVQDSRSGHILNGKWRVSFSQNPVFPAKKTNEKKTFLYTRDGGFIGEFKSRGDAVAFLGINSNNVTSYSKSVKFLDSPGDPCFKPLAKVRYKDIVLYSVNGKCAMTFPDTAAICKHFGVSNQMVSLVLRGGAKLRGEWVPFIEDFPVPIVLDRFIQVHVSDGNKTPAHIIPVGYTFDFFFEAARFTGLHINRVKALAKHDHFYMRKFKVEMDGDKIRVWVKTD